KSHTYFLFALLILLMEACPVFPQEMFFNKILPPEGKDFVHVTGIVQDKQGYLWFASRRRLYRYDGITMISYINNPLNPNSLVNNNLESICADSSGIIWVGSLTSGVDRFDPSTGIFRNFRHDPKDSASLSSNCI